MKLVALISSGIDSPVATYLVSQKADALILLHADNRPFTDDREIEKFIALARFLKTLVPSKLSAYLLPHGQTLKEFKICGNNRYTCVVCKRMMLRYAEAISQKEGAAAIVMGDSLGQVASQTLQNLRVVEQAVSIPILRPLIGFDKEDTIKIAKQIGTFDLSIAPADGCAAVPTKPSTQARLEHILAEEQKLDVKKLVHDVISRAEIVTL
jgi:thiamine biosynthesis protein ThiI